MTDNNEPRLVWLGFADNIRPEFKESKFKDWILFGDDNKFPDHILYLFDKSSVHGAIINNKVIYIVGKGIDCTDPKLKTVNRYGESMNKVLEKSCKDVELFGGFYWQIIYNALGSIKEIIHTPFQQIRKGKEKGWWHCKSWDKLSKYSGIKPTQIDDFDALNPKGVQLFSYKEYRPGDQQYPLPGYFSALNDIETDAEISIYNLSVMKNGQFTGKLISFFSGKITEEKAEELEKKWNKKFSGSGNAGRTMLSFNDGAAKEPKVDDLSSTDLDKLFDQLRKSTEAKIFAGHTITSPMLFGIAEPGKLGGRNEMQDSYEIFKLTYANYKQQALEEVLALFLPLLGLPAQKIIPVDPIAGLAPDGKAAVSPNTNENLRNMTGRQFQNLERVIRKYRNGKLDKLSAALLLKNSFGLGDEDIEVMLSNEEGFQKEYSEEDVAEMFAGCGEQKMNFSVVKSKRFSFEDMATDKFVQTFADIKGNDSSILDLIKKDKRITPEIIAQTLGVEKSYVESRLKVLTEKGVLKQSSSVIGADTIIEHSIVREMIDTIEKPETIDVYIRYSYEPKPGLEPIIETTRPFCKRLIDLDRFYSRAEIETISQRVGYSVWDRKGGWWGDNPECRHEWKRNIITKIKR